MAHEHLNFNLHLKENKENEWQPILGAQEHNTFFMVYVRFDKISKETNQFGKEEWVHNCTFRIQNFRGSISFGFCGVPNIGFPDYLIPPKNEIGTSIIIELEAFCHKEIERATLKSANPLDKSRLLETLYSIRIGGLYDKKEPLKSKYLNPYRYQRDGDEVIEIGYKTKGSNKFKPILDDIGGDFGICSPNLSKLI